MQQNIWKVMGLSLILTAFLTGCTIQLPPSEQESLQVLVEVGKHLNNGQNKGTVTVSSASTNTNSSNTNDLDMYPNGGSGTITAWMPPGQAKKMEKQDNDNDKDKDDEGKGNSRKVEKAQTASVQIIGALVHPVGLRYPQIVTADGITYNVVLNHTSYDIYTVRKEVPYLMVKVAITGQSDLKVYSADLVEVVAQGKFIPASMSKHKNSHNFKFKNKNYTVIDNRSGKDLDKFIGKDSYYFVQEVGEDHGSVKVIIYAVY